MERETRQNVLLVLALVGAFASLALVCYTAGTGKGPPPSREQVRAKECRGKRGHYVWQHDLCLPEGSFIPLAGD